VREIKTKCLTSPETYLWRTTTSKIPELHNIFYKIKQLQYSDRPDYEYIRNQLKSLQQKEEQSQPSLETGISSGVKLFVIKLEEERT
jgi:hypothetical protein